MQTTKYELNEVDFQRFRKLISHASGIYFDRGKWGLLRLGLAERAEALGVDNLTDYYQELTVKPRREEEIRRLLNHLSVQETQFFRNLPQFDALRKYVIPELVRRKARGGHRSLRFWSAGCSTGEEPYTIAMSALDALPDTSGWQIQVLATDLSDDALEIASRGWYPEKKLKGLDRVHKERYFRPQDGGYVVSEPVRRMVSFTRHNMVTEPLPISAFGTCDVIFCRNVIIYFTPGTAKYVIELFYDILNPGGYLFLGHSETLWKMSAKYSLVEMGDAFIYKKSLPRSLEGRRFIPERRLRRGPLPPGIERDRRLGSERRGAVSVDSLINDVRKSREDRGIGEMDGKEPEQAAEDSGEAPLAKGRTFLDLGEYDRAVENLERILEQEKTCAEAHYLMGLALEKQDQLSGAADSFRKTIYCDGTHSLACFHLACVLERMGKLRSAVREYRNAAGGFRNDTPERWERELDAYDLDALISLCEWKIENLAAAGC